MLPRLVSGGDVNEDRSDNSPTTIGDYAAIVWRRRLAVLVAVLGIPVVAVGLSLLQTPEYTASAEALIRTENVAAVLSGVTDLASGQDPKRRLDTQSRLARTAAVAASAIEVTGVDMSPQEFLGRTSASADPSADILTFSARDSEPDVAVALANAYAGAYTRYRADLDLRPVEDALATVNARLAMLRAAGSTESPVYSTLLARQQELQSMRSLRTPSAVIVERATEAPKTKPRLAYVGVLALIVGMLLGVAIALAREAIEKRPRSIEEVERRLGLRVLGRIPATREGATDLVTLSHPHTVDAEAYRLLRMYFEHVAQDVGGRVIALASVSDGEGKSTVASNLAVALARAGRNVILVDGDPIRPTLRERFGITRPGPGAFDVARGRASLDNAYENVSFDDIAADAEWPYEAVPAGADADHVPAERVAQIRGEPRYEESSPRADPGQPPRPPRVSNLRRPQRLPRRDEAGRALRTTPGGGRACHRGRRAARDELWHGRRAARGRRRSRRQRLGCPPPDAGSPRRDAGRAGAAEARHRADRDEPGCSDAVRLRVRPDARAAPGGHGLRITGARGGPPVGIRVVVTPVGCGGGARVRVAPRFRTAGERARGAVRRSCCLDRAPIRRPPRGAPGSDSIRDDGRGSRNGETVHSTTTRRAASTGRPWSERPFAPWA